MENHVEYILVASFDIDRGSVMEHQYPGPISGDETMLAELMLPDQAHMRSLDWTIFFLHKDTSAEEEAKELRRKKRRRRKNGEDEDEDEGSGQDSTRPSLEADADDYANELDEDDEESEGPPLVYVLNLVNTKHDNTVKRYISTRNITWLHKLIKKQRRDCQSDGDMYKTFISPHLQGTTPVCPELHSL